MPLVIQPDFTAVSVAKLLVLCTYWRWQDNPLADAEHTQDEVNALWDELYDDLQDARYDTRHQGVRTSIPNRIHHTWERNYEVDVRVINLGDGRGLALNNVTGGGKHGVPEAFPWWQEAWFVKHTGTTTVVKHTYEDIPEVKDVPATK